MDTHRAILHSDCNSFYASVEQCEHPELRERPLVVGGDEESRHGIVLTGSREAKRCGIKAGMALWQARQACPGLTIVPPDYALYLRYSRMARAIYYQYTPQVEPFGLDECWLDVTGSLHAYCNDPLIIATEISERIKAELGITVSIGVSWNKIFAKFGSDYEKPDAITCITPRSYRRIVWASPVEDLLYVGPATTRKMHDLRIETVGDLAHARTSLLQQRFGVIGPMLQRFARGEDATPVKEFDPQANDVSRMVKSFGNGLTAPHDLVTARDAKALIALLAESVAQRLRENHLRASCISIGVRRADDLSGYTRQVTLSAPTDLTRELLQASWQLLATNEPFDGTRALRALHVRASRLSPAASSQQLDLFGNERERLRFWRLDCAIDALRNRFGNRCIQRGTALLDAAYNGIDIKRDNIIHPVGLLGS